MIRMHSPLFLPVSLTLGLALAACDSGDSGAGSSDSTSDSDTDGVDSDSGGTTGGSDGTTAGSSGGTTGDSGGTTGDSGGTTGDSGGTTGDSGGTTGDSGGSTGGADDTTPPTVVSVTPADGDVGVREDADIVITFSEPMDKAASQAAWQSADLPSGDVVMSWNAAGDELTVTPNNGLPYATGSDPALVDALEYSFSMTTVATDKAGNELESATMVSFSTARHITEELSAAGKLSGSVRQDDVFWLDDMEPGDTGNAEAENAQIKGYVTFELSNLPADVLEFLGGDLEMEQIHKVGSPYTQLGDLVLFTAAFVDWAKAFDAPATDLGKYCSDMVPQVCNADVTASIEAGHAANDDLIQFGVRFTDATDVDGNNDFVRFMSSDAVLTIDYLLE